MTAPFKAQTGRFRPFVYAAIVYLLVLQVGALALNVPIALRGGGDFPSFYRAGLMVRTGARKSLYGIDEQVRYEGRFLPRNGSRIQLYYHPAFQALAIAPLTFLSYKAAFWVWSVAGVGALLLGARLLAPELGILSEAAGIPLWLIFVCFFPVANTILQGQDSLFLFALLAFAYREFRCNRDVMAGVALALALFKFQYIVPLVFILTLLRWRPKLLFSFGAMALALAGISWAVVGNSGVIAYWHLTQHHEPEHNWQMMNLRGLVITLGGDPWVVIALSLGLALWCGFWKMARGTGEFLVALVAAVLVSYHMHVYDMSILLIPLAVIMNQSLKGKEWKRLLLPGLFWVTPLYGLLLHTDSYFLFSLPLFALLFLIPLWCRDATSERKTVPMASA